MPAPGCARHRTSRSGHVRALLRVAHHTYLPGQRGRRHERVRTGPPGGPRRPADAARPASRGIAVSTRRRAVWGGAVAVLLAAGVGAALVSRPLPPSPRGPEPGRTLFQAHCATCHGAAGRCDSWRARLLLLRPGNLASPAMASVSDPYLADL